MEFKLLTMNEVCDEQFNVPYSVPEPLTCKQFIIEDMEKNLMLGERFRNWAKHFFFFKG